jgi:plastocyanin
MESKYYIKIGIIALILGVIALSGCVQNQQKNPQNTTIPQNASQSKVLIQNFTYNPNTLTVKAGTNVTWINHDSVIHDVSSDTGAFASKDLTKGESYTHNFTKPGEYPYHCNEHPYMTGKIIVQ